MSVEEYRRVTDVTYFGQIHGTRAALDAHAAARFWQRSYLSGSALAYRGIPLQSAYCAAKHAIQGFQDFLLRVELLAMDSNIRLTMVQLPGVDTAADSTGFARIPAAPSSGRSDLPARSRCSGHLEGRAFIAQAVDRWSARLPGNRSRQARFAFARQVPRAREYRGATGRAASRRPQG